MTNSDDSFDGPTRWLAYRPPPDKPNPPAQGPSTSNQWPQVLSIPIEGWKAFGQACGRVALDAGYIPARRAPSPMRDAIRAINTFTAMVKAAPGSFHKLVSDAGGMPVVWATGKSSRELFQEVVLRVLSSAPESPTSEQRDAFAAAMAAARHIEKLTEDDPEDISRQAQGGPAGFPIFLKTAKEGLPPTPAIIERLTAQRVPARFDLLRSRRGGAPDIIGTNRIAACFHWTASALLGGKKLLTFDAPERSVLLARVKIVTESPGVPELKGLRWFMADQTITTQAMAVPSEMVRIVWQLIEAEGCAPERIPQFRALAGLIRRRETEKAITSRIRKEISRRIDILKPG